MTAFVATQPRAVIVGGSLSGLFAAVLLRDLGWNVDVYERSPGDLESRGGGIVLQPDVVTLFARIGVDATSLRGVEAHERVYLARDGRVDSRIATPQTQTSWSALYRALRDSFPAENYHYGDALVAIEQGPSRVRAQFDSGASTSADLLIGADGGGSTVRSLLLPSLAPSYAGYVAFRGLVPERELPTGASDVLRDRFVFFQYPQSHMLSYLVAGDDLSVSEGDRRFNWVWYRNIDEANLADTMTDRHGRRRERSIPPGALSSRVEEELRADAEASLAWPFRELVRSTAEPFAHPVLDLGVPRMVFGRVLLLGDAAFLPRPHTAASTSKAANDALMLSHALWSAPESLASSLALWEASQLRLGRRIVRSGQTMGDTSQFPNGKRVVPGKRYGS